MAAQSADAAFAALLSTLERLAAALGAPPGCADPTSAAALRPLVCGAAAHLRAAGATPDQVVARLPAALVGGAPPALPQDVLRARVAAVVAWCEAAAPQTSGQPRGRSTGRRSLPPPGAVAGGR